MNEKPPRNEPADPLYIEFAVQSNFSFLRGASRPEELVVAACMLGHAGMGLADRNTVAGVVRAWSASKYIHIENEKAPQKSIGPFHLPYHPGCRLVFSDGTPDMLAYPQDRKGWGHLCRMLTVANMRGEKGNPDLLREDLLEWGDCISLAAFVDFSWQEEASLALLRELRQRFGGNLWLAFAHHYDGSDRLHLEQAAGLSAAAGIPLMAVNDVLYHSPERRPLQDVLTAIRLNTPVARAGYELAANAERHLKPGKEMARLFRRHPEAVAETLRFASTLRFSLDELSHNYPDEPTRDGATPDEELARLAWEGAAFRYPEGIPEKVVGRIRDELALIARLEYARYFLTVHEIVQFARSKGILCQGRGSAANSAVCYCVGITEVDPDRIDSLFERFISEERKEPPDIDVDFEHERRDEVMAFVYEKYTEKCTALAASVVTYRGRSALREVAKAMGLSEDVRSALSGSVWGWWTDELGDKQAKAGGLAEDALLRRNVIERSNELIGIECPRHLSQHVGGFVITKDRLDEIVPIVKTAMDERKMVEWDKDDLDAVGLIKVDVLALGMLSCLRRALDLLHAHYAAEETHDPHGRPYTLATLPPEDGNVYAMIQRADTLGVFQIESRAQMSMLPRLKPKEFYDLVIEVAIVRPGPIQGDMVHPYLRRRQGLEEVTYPKSELETILGKTMGVPLFQEQAMKIAIVAAGFEPAKADKLRRAMATFRRNGTIGTLKDEFIQGMENNGYERDFAERCFKQIEGFGDYGFPESHAASFALLVYASCWFKAFYPDVFCAATLNAQPMGFYAPAQLVRDAREHGIEVHEADINHSGWDCTLEESPFDTGRIAKRHASMRGVIKSRHAVRLGFRLIKGLSKKSMENFVGNRGGGYTSTRDVWLRSGLDAGEIERLAMADAFRSIGLNRRQALWAVRALDGRNASEQIPLFDRVAAELNDNEPTAMLPVMPVGEHVIQDYRALGLSLKAHPVSFLRERLHARRITPNAALLGVPNGRRVSVAGLVLVRQRPGKGNAIFLTLEDEGGIANIVVWQRDFDRLLPTIMASKFIAVTGRLQAESGVIHIAAETMDNLTAWLGDLSEEAASIETVARGDEVKRPGMDRRHEAHRQHNKGGRSAATGISGNGPEARKAEKVMPKGRNFH